MQEAFRNQGEYSPQIAKVLETKLLYKINPNFAKEV